MPETRRMTTAQAIVRHLRSQFIAGEAGERVPLFAGVFGIFGHGNVTCLSEALEQARDDLPTWRGQNEQSMALAAIAYAKAMRRRRIMIATSSVGPGATNMVTAAAVAHANRLPVLLLSGDTFSNRLPDPVLQQVEHFGAPSTTVNDSFRAVSRYWDRITHPAQILSSLPQAIATMLDPADCGPAFIGLPQDVQEIAYDYPEAFFEEKTWRIARPRPDKTQVAAAAELLKTAKRPLLVCGGGARYSQAEEPVAEFAAKRGIPLAETIAGKGSVTHAHPNCVGNLGIEGTDAAKTLAENADVVLAVGTRLQDFTTGSWTVFAPEARLIHINAARFDAGKHRAAAVVGDARESLAELDAALGDWAAPSARLEEAWALRAAWDAAVDAGQAPDNAELPSYAQIVGVVNRAAGERDRVVTAAGGLPGETAKNWRVKAPGTFDCEFGYSCMGYEIAGGWGHAMAMEETGADGVPVVLVGDGSYMMMNSDIYSSVLAGHKMIVVVCDNGGFGVIHRLQTGMGVPGFNNLLADCRREGEGEPARVDFVRHAESMGAHARLCESLSALEEGMAWAQGTDATTVLVIACDPYRWTPGGADWYVGVPEVSERESVREARAGQEAFRKLQRQGV